MSPLLSSRYSYEESAVYVPELTSLSIQCSLTVRTSLVLSSASNSSGLFFNIRSRRATLLLRLAAFLSLIRCSSPLVPSARNWFVSSLDVAVSLLSRFRMTVSWKHDSKLDFRLLILVDEEDDVEDHDDTSSDGRSTMDDTNCSE